MQKLKASSIIVREDLYPRFELNAKLVQKYKQCLDQLPPIDINQDKILIDGYHRLTAFRSEKREDIPVNIIKTKTEKEVLKLAIQKNATHGMQLESDEKRKYAIEFIAEMSVKELASILSVDERTIRDWTKNRRVEIKEDRDREILRLSLNGINTYRTIGKIVGCDHKTVSSVIEKMGKNGRISEIPQDFEHQLFDYWQYDNADNVINDTGKIPQDIIEQLLYYYTKPLDLVYDPFAGTGTTIDACKKWQRRFYASDINVLPERQGYMSEWNITNGLPDDILIPRLTFLDPPDWQRDKGKYSNEPTDLSNMNLDNFLNTIGNIAKAVKIKLNGKRGYLALLISQIKVGRNYISLPHLCWQQIEKYWRDIISISIPYSIESYNQEDIELAIKNKYMLCISRNLIVFR